MNDKTTGIKQLKNGEWSATYKRKQIGIFTSKEEAVKAREKYIYDNLDSESRFYNKCYDLIKELYGYDNNQMLTKFTVLRIRGIVKGKFCDNDLQSNNANYSFENLYYTILLCRNSIKYSIRTVNFKDESHMTNYVFKIIEGKLNDVYIRMKNAKSNELKTQVDDVIPIKKGSENYRVSEKSETNKFNDLW
nr:MAG TPA: hypothetical protein [Caudoviricetes sp.]